MKLRDLTEQAKTAFGRSIPKDIPSFVQLATQTLTTSLALSITKNSVEATFLGETLGTMSGNFAQGLMGAHRTLPSSAALSDAPYPTLAVAPVERPDSTPGFFCFALGQDADQRIRPRVGTVFGPFFGSEALATEWAESLHPLYLEKLTDGPSRLAKEAETEWFGTFDPTLPFHKPLTPWVVAQMYTDPPLFGAWRSVLTPRGAAIEALAATADPDVWEPSLTLPPAVAQDVGTVRRAIRSVGPAGQSIPDLLYLPRELHGQLTWEQDAALPDRLVLKRTVPQPQDIMEGPAVGTRVVLRAGTGAVDKQPSWYVGEVGRNDTRLWRPLEEGGLAFGGYLDADKAWTPYRFPNHDAAFTFLQERSLWSQVHPGLAIMANPVTPSL